VICNYCNKPGHYKADCFELQRKNQNLGKRNQRNGMVSAQQILFGVLVTHMSPSRTSGLLTLKHLVTTATEMKICLIKQQFLR
jgi:hypothetical protein